LGDTALRRCELLPHQLLDLVEGPQRQHPQIRRDHAIVGLNPELTELIRRRPLGGQPHRLARRRLAELVSIGAQHEWMGEGVGCIAEPAPNELDPGNDVAPLVAASGLQLHVVGLVEVAEVVGLQQHVAELGVTDAVLALDAAAHRVLRRHLVHREVLADVTEKLQHRDRRSPVGVVDQGGLERAGLEVQQFDELALDAFDVAAQGLGVEQIAFVAATPRVADHAGGATSQRKRPMAGQLEATEEQLADEMSDVQRVGRGVEADVQPDRPLRQPGAKCGQIGGVVDQATRMKVVEQIHSASCCQVRCKVPQPLHGRARMRVRDGRASSHAPAR